MQEQATNFIVSGRLQLGHYLMLQFHLIWYSRKYSSIIFWILLGYAEIKCQLDATEVFIAELIACSTCFGHHYGHHQELKSIIQWLLPVVFRAVKM